MWCDLLSRVDHAADAVTLLHLFKGGVDVGQRLAVRDEFVHLELAGQIIINEVWELGTAFDATEGAALPHTTGNQLECYTTVSVHRQITCMRF